MSGEGEDNYSRLVCIYIYILFVLIYSLSGRRERGIGRIWVGYDTVAALAIDSDSTYWPRWSTMLIVWPLHVRLAPLD